MIAWAGHGVMANNNFQGDHTSVGKKITILIHIRLVIAGSGVVKWGYRGQVSELPDTCQFLFKFFQLMLAVEEVSCEGGRIRSKCSGLVIRGW